MDVGEEKKKINLYEMSTREMMINSGMRKIEKGV